MNGYIDSIESFGLVDGPGIRTVVFLKGCQLRCLYCHNPEMWKMNGSTISPDELVSKIKRNKPYFKRNHGGVTFSGGEPLLQKDFLIAVMTKLRQENIHIALDTAGVGIGDYDKILSLVDLVLFDVKYADKEGYQKLTGYPIDESEKFIEALNKSGKPVWIRQVIVPSMMDNEDYLKKLALYLNKINNIEKIEFLPFHHLGFNKYEKLHLPNSLINIPEMDPEKCEKLFASFQKIRANIAT